MNNIKIDYHIPLTGGVYTQASSKFNRSKLDHLSRCLKAVNSDAGIMIQYE